MRHKTFFIILVIMAVIVSPYRVIYATPDSDEETSTVTLIILPSLNLAITDAAVSKTLVKDLTAEDAFDVGYVEFDANKPTLELSSNSGWKLFARSAGFTGPYSKPVGDLQLKDISSLHVKNGFNDYQSLSAIDQEIASDSAAIGISETHPCQYKILLDWKADIPGTYEATVTYTLSTSGT